MRPVRCPSASSSCGFLEFFSNHSHVQLYECVDQSVFMSEEDEEIGRGVSAAAAPEITFPGALLAALLAHAQVPHSAHGHAEPAVPGLPEQ